MGRKFRIGIRLQEVHTFDPTKPGNVWGDELIARGWQKYLLRHDAVEFCELFGPAGAVETPLDVMIHFHPWLELCPGATNIAYLQTAFPDKNKPERADAPNAFPGGTVGAFNHYRDRFDYWMFTSDLLMQSCCPGAVIPFATDPDFFCPQPSNQYAHPVSFVGNNIRSRATNLQYFEPALNLGLVIYGNGWHPPLAQVCRGKLPMPDLPKLYTDSHINLNAHITEHGEFGTTNLRIYDILACGGFILSDYTQSLYESFGDLVICTDGYEDTWAKIVHYLAEPELRQKYSQESRQRILSHHSYQHRMQRVLEFLKEIL